MKETRFNSAATLMNEKDYNEASSLYEKILSAGEDPYQTIMEMQHSLQEKLAATYPDRGVIPPRAVKTVGELYDLVASQREAMNDEMRELIDAIPGMSKPQKDRSGCWKRWKSNYDSIRAEDITKMSKEDRLELLMECTDFLHFWVNIQLGLGLSAKDMFMLYFAKNAENFRRANSGY